MSLKVRKFVWWLSDDIWGSHLSYTAIHWSTNSEASYSMTALVQSNHYLVVLPYLKLSFSYAVPTALVQTTTHRLETSLLLWGFPWELTVLPWRLQGFSLWEIQLHSDCLFESHSGTQVYYQYRALFKLVKICWQITCGEDYNKYWTLQLKMLTALGKNFKHFGWEY